MAGIVAGECHGDHEDQRQNGEQQNSQGGQRHKGDVRIIVGQLPYILLEVPNSAGAHLRFLGLVGAAAGDGGKPNQGDKAANSHHAIEQYHHRGRGLVVMPVSVDFFFRLRTIAAESWQFQDFLQANGEEPDQGGNFDGEEY